MTVWGSLKGASVKYLNIGLGFIVRPKYMARVYRNRKVLEGVLMPRLCHNVGPFAYFRV